MIDVSGLTLSFGSKKVLDHVSLNIEKNEICALVGRNGAGKSTFINCLLGLAPAQGGRIAINGKEQAKTKSWINEISYLPEKFMLYPALTGYENMKFFAQSGKGKANEERIKEILTSVGLWKDRDFPVKSYSKGMLQRLGLAVILYPDSGIIILDEPTSGIDPIGRQEILKVLKELKNKTILLSSHHLDEIQQICSTVAFLEEGKMTKYTVDGFLIQQRLGGF
ncbi:ABC transporter ATP-binding protein [Mesobacillus campisalis]|uniref:ABC transporter ATP-binding protein n=1 Tax=Mesobacillus campisalis TaxID=1408103 RepID=A0A0M2SWD6_9BACI|nr:ABC transporter ATP-binding protein [Mesobacillus campisalis]KKK38026.1 ABC transporter ATP-binding protein [Mesobacillus campisalis]